MGASIAGSSGSRLPLSCLLQGLLKQSSSSSIACGLLTGDHLPKSNLCGNKQGMTESLHACYRVELPFLADSSDHHEALPRFQMRQFCSGLEWSIRRADQDPAWPHHNAGSKAGILQASASPYRVIGIRGFPVVRAVEECAERYPNHSACWDSDTSYLGELGGGTIGTSCQDRQHSHTLLQRGTNVNITQLVFRLVHIIGLSLLRCAS